MISGLTLNKAKLEMFFSHNTLGHAKTLLGKGFNIKVVSPLEKYLGTTIDSNKISQKDIA